MEKKSVEKTVQPKGLRMPMIKVPADIEDLSHLSEDEKEMARENLRFVPPTEPFLLLKNDPLLARMCWNFEYSMSESFFPEWQSNPCSVLNLIILEVARVTNYEFLTGLISAGGINTPLERTKDFSPLQLSMLQYPDAEVWTEEQRLAIKFTDAALDCKMDDDLYEKCVAAWGKKRFLRYLVWVGWVRMYSHFSGVLNHKFNAESANAFPEEFYTGVVPPEIHRPPAGTNDIGPLGLTTWKKGSRTKESHF